jgi:hypothetical protein
MTKMISVPRDGTFTTDMMLAALDAISRKRKQLNDPAIPEKGRAVLIAATIYQAMLSAAPDWGKEKWNELGWQEDAP